MKVHFYLRRDADGKLAGEGVEEGPRVTLATIQARQPAGVTVLDAAEVARPPASPDPIRVKHARLAELRVKGWTNLTLAEKDEARAIAFDVGAPSPPAA